MFVRLFYLLLFLFRIVNARIDIRDANVAALSRDDIGMIFYITVQNTDLCSYDIKVNMVECTEEITDKDKDSGFMYLIGGHMGVLRQKCFKNITMLYPNMYLHNRRGFCIISIKFKSESDKIFQKKANITFDTWLSKKVTPAILRDCKTGFYTRNEVRTCESVDLDPLNKCSPVDCHMKYVGTRNYFNKKWQRCQKVPVCIADSSKEMPDVIYTPSNNKCRDMEKSVTRGDLQQIESGTPKGPCDVSYKSLLNMNCHFGKYNNISGICECDEGWMSAPIDKDSSDGSTLFVYHMCNIEINGWYDTSSRKIKTICLVMGISAVMVAMVIILCSFLINQCYNCIKSFENRDNYHETGSKKSKSSKSSLTSKGTESSRSKAKSKTSTSKSK